MKPAASRAMVITYWVFTVVLCLQMSFTAYAQLHLPQVAAMFAHLDFPPYFRVELSWAKYLAAVILLVPVPAWLKEWAYAGYGITLLSALIAHWAVGDNFAVWQWAAGTGILWCVSFVLWRRQAAQAIALKGTERVLQPA